MIQFTKSLSGLAVEEVDLFLLHYPACWPGLCGEGFTPKGTWHDSWRALEDLMDKGLVRAIGAWPLAVQSPYYKSYPLTQKRVHPVTSGCFAGKMEQRLQHACAVHESEPVGVQRGSLHAF